MKSFLLGVTHTLAPESHTMGNEDEALELGCDE